MGHKHVLFAALALTVPPVALANDSAASVAAGGIELRKEPRISMAKERLSVKAWQEEAGEVGRRYLQDRYAISVEYDFVNTADVEVTTEVAFPVPEYGYGGVAMPTPEFRGFRAWADTEEIKVQEEVRCFLKDGTEVTSRLRELGVPGCPFPEWGEDGPKPGWYARFGQSADEGLRASGLIEDGFWPAWRRRVTWHWTQSFPAKKTVHVRHEYRPEYGYEPVHIDEILTKHRDACFDPKTADAWGEEVAKRRTLDGRYIHLTWVEYILKTANNWQRPIKDFELVVEAPADWTASFCWDGTVERVSSTVLRARAKDFTPTKDLIVYFRPKR